MHININDNVNELRVISDEVCFVLCLVDCSLDCNVQMQPGRKTQLYVHVGMAETKMYRLGLAETKLKINVT